MLIQHTPAELSYLLSRPAAKTVWVELVGVEDVNGTFDAQVVKLTGHLKSQKVVLSEEQWEKISPP